MSGYEASRSRHRLLRALLRIGAQSSECAYDASYGRSRATIRGRRAPA